MPRITSSRILITSWGSFGDVYPYVGLARALAARGHRPMLAVPKLFRSLVEGEGFEFRAVGPEVDVSDRALVARIMDPRRGTKAILHDLLMPPLRRTFEELKDAARGADLLVSHPVTFAAPPLAQKTGIPWASTVLAPMSFFSATDPPVLPPAPQLAELSRRSPLFGRILVGLARRMTRSWMTPVHELRIELGLDRGSNPIFEGQFSPALTLGLFSRLLAKPQADWPPHVLMTGFVFYNGPDRLPPELEGFLDAGSPPVVFTLGTSAVGAAGPFYRESLKAARKLGVRAVLMTGGYADNDPGGDHSSDFLVVDRAPHQLLFPRAAAVVHQVGIGTTGQALRAGRPMLVVPHAHDQFDNAFRVAKLGVARTVFPGSYKAPRVAGELQRLLTDASFERRAQEVAKEVRGERGADGAAEALEQLMASRTSHGGVVRSLAG